MLEKISELIRLEHRIQRVSDAESIRLCKEFYITISLDSSNKTKFLASMQAFLENPKIEDIHLDFLPVGGRHETVYGSAEASFILEAVLQLLEQKNQNKNKISRFSLKNLAIDEYWCKQLAKSLVTNYTLVKLDLSGCKINEYGIRVLTSALRNNLRLGELLLPNGIAYDSKNNQDLKLNNACRAIYQHRIKEFDDYHSSGIVGRLEWQVFHNLFLLLLIKQEGNNAFSSLPPELIFSIMSYVCEMTVKPTDSIEPCYTALPLPYPYSEILASTSPWVQVEIAKIIHVKSYKNVLEYSENLAELHASLVNYLSQNRIPDLKEESPIEALVCKIHSTISNCILYRASLETKLQALDCFLYFANGGRPNKSFYTVKVEELARTICQERLTGADVDEADLDAMAGKLIFSRELFLFPDKVDCEEKFIPKDYSNS